MRPYSLILADYRATLARLDALHTELRASTLHLSTVTASPDANHIVQFVAGRLRVPAREILGRSHQRDIVFARWCAWYLYHRHASAGLSLSAVARTFAVDHGTVSYGLRKLRDWRETVKEVDKLLISLDTECPSVPSVPSVPLVASAA